jgi:hypothetical protein
MDYRYRCVRKEREIREGTQASGHTGSTGTSTAASSEMVNERTASAQKMVQVRAFKGRFGVSWSNTLGGLFSEASSAFGSA